MLLRRLLAVPVVAALVLLLLPSQALAATGATSSAAAERLLVDLVNQRRAEVGVAPLTPRSDLHATARAWSFTQAEQADLGHNDDLASTVCCWTRLTENVAQSVGTGGPDDAARRLYELWRNATAVHDRNMTDPAVDQVGVGVVIDDDGAVWGTTVFRACDGSACTGGAQRPAADTTRTWGAPPPPPTPSPSPSPSPTPSPTPTPAPTPAAEPAPEPTAAAAQPPAAPAPDASPSPSPSPTPGPSPTAAPGPSPSPSRTPSPSPSPTARPTASPSPAAAATELLAAGSVAEQDDDGPGGSGLPVLAASLLAIAAARAFRVRD